MRASHVPFDAEVGASYAPIAHRLARGGGFHLCELASTATRVGLSNFFQLAYSRTDIGVRHLRALAMFEYCRIAMHYDHPAGGGDYAVSPL